MPIVLETSDIKLVSQIDSCVNCTVEEYEEYLKNLDEEILNLEGEPTRFVLCRSLNWRLSTQIGDKRVGMDKDGTVQLKSATAMMEEVRASLKNIEHPEGVEPGKLAYVTEKDKLAGKELIAFMNSYGIVTDCFKALSYARKNVEDLKKS